MKSVSQEVKDGFYVMLRAEQNVETGLRQRKAKQFALAWAVFD